MDADFTIELGPEDPTLEFPWTDPSGKVAYYDVKRRPELMVSIAESEKFSELGNFLRVLNSARSAVETAKCDAWTSREFNAEEDIYNASHKFASYVDFIVSNIEGRESLPLHEQFVRKLVALLQRAPETPSAAEVCVRRCYYAGDIAVREGLYFTLYVTGYGNDEAGARQNWGVGLKLAGHAILQLSAED
jgi:hypothetical protein